MGGLCFGRVRAHGEQLLGLLDPDTMLGNVPLVVWDSRDGDSRRRRPGGDRLCSPA